MFKDKLILAGMAGFIGVLVETSLDYLFVLLRISNATTAQFIASIIYCSHHLNFTQLIVGEIGHLIAGAVVGLIPLVLYFWSGKAYALIKGGAIGAGLWLNHVILVPSFVDPRIHLIFNTPSLLAELFALIFWGIVAYGIIVKYGGDIK